MFTGDKPKFIYKEETSYGMNWYGYRIKVPGGVLSRTREDADGNIQPTQELVDYVFTHYREAYEADLANTIKNSRLYEEPKETNNWFGDNDYE
jgi:hypothetical protein